MAEDTHRFLDDDEAIDSEFVIFCSRCGVQIGTESQAAIDELRERLADDGGGCDDPRGHEFEQVRP